MNDKPWMDIDAINWLEKFSFSNVFEWGSGGSTIFFAKRSKNVFSIENNDKWYKDVVAELKKQSLNNVIIQHIPCDGFGKNIMGLKDYTSNSQLYKNRKFEAYAKAIDTHPDNSFDLVLVDGRARISCMYHAIAKVKSGGYLILDDSQRDYYTPGINLLKGWKTILFKGNHSTRAWEKPNSE